MPAGRPKIKLDDLPEGWRDFVIDLYRDGASDVEIRAELDITEGTFYRLLSEEDEFFQTIKRGRLLSQLWWERNGRINLHSTTFNSTLWYMNMKNRFGWRDKQEISGDDKSPLAFTLKIGEGGKGD